MYVAVLSLACLLRVGHALRWQKANDPTVEPLRGASPEVRGSTTTDSLSRALAGTSLSSRAAVGFNPSSLKVKSPLVSIALKRKIAADGRSSTPLQVMVRQRPTYSHELQVYNERQDAAIDLQKAIKSANSPADLLRLHEERSTVFDSMHISHFWGNLGRLSRSDKGYLLRHIDESESLRESVVKLAPGCSGLLCSQLAHGMAKAGVRARGAWNEAWDSVELSCRANVQDFNPQSLGMTAWAFAKARKDAPELMDLLASRGAATIQYFNSQNLANTAWAFATLRHDAPLLFNAIADEAAGRVCELHAQHLVNIAWAFATAGHQATALFDALAGETALRVTELIPQGLANVAWAFAKAEHHTPALFQALAAETTRQIRDLSPQGIANVAWAFGKAGHEEPALFEALAHEAAGRVHEFRPAELTGTARAFATLSNEELLMTPERPSLLALWPALAGEIRRNVQHFTPQELAGTMWAFAKAGLKMLPLFDAVAVETMRRMHHFDAQDLGSMAWAFATLGHEAPELFEALGKELSARVTELDAQSLANVAWAFAKAGHKAPALFEVLAQEVTGRISEFLPQGLANVAWACAKVGHEAPVLFKALGGEAQRQMQNLNYQDIANMAWAFAKGRHEAPELFEAFANELLGHLHKLKPQELANTAWAFAKAGQDAPALFEALAGEAAGRLHEFSAQYLANIAWAFATLGYREPTLFEALAVEVASRVCEFTPQGLANIAWAFREMPAVFESETGEAVHRCIDVAEDGEVSTVVADLFCALQHEAFQRFDEFGALELLALYGAYASAQLLCSNAKKRFTDKAMGLGRQHDNDADIGRRENPLDQSRKVQVSTVDSLAPLQLSNEPCLLSAAEHWMAVYKPPSWLAAVSATEALEALSDAPLAGKGEINERDGLHSKTEQHRQIHQWIGHNFEDQYPICSDALTQHGMLHRLDVDTSGLLLCAKSYVGNYWLRLQWCGDRVDKEYICLVHGWVDASLREVNKPIQVHRSKSQQTISNLCTISSSGKPSKTELVTLAHLVKESKKEARSEHDAEGDRYSLVAVKLRTGRTHQIRVHMLSIGHPVVSDFKYAEDKFPADQSWCTRNFLHTHRLGFEDVPQDAVGKDCMVDMICPLPADLRKALEALKPVDSRGDRLYADWISGEGQHISGFERYAADAFGTPAVVGRTNN